MDEAAAINVRHASACVIQPSPIPSYIYTPQLKKQVTGALRVHKLASTLNPNSPTRLIHVSTAFVHPKPAPNTLLPESLVPLSFGPSSSESESKGEGDPLALYHSITDGTQWLASRTMRRGGWVNTYTFTKALAEHLLARRCGGAGVDLRIVRPAIVGPAWAFPEPGESWRMYFMYTSYVYMGSQSALQPTIHHPNTHSSTPHLHSGYLGQKPSTLSACLVLRMSGLLRVFPMGTHAHAHTQLHIETTRACVGIQPIY